MKLHRLAVTAALAMVSLQAVAYTFAVEGIQTHFRSKVECPGNVCPDGRPVVVNDPWHATFTLTTPDDVGIFNSTRDQVGLAVEQNGTTTDFLFGFYAYPYFEASVSGGRVLSWGGGALLTGGTWGFTGSLDKMRVDFHTPATEQYGHTFGHGTIVSHAPEPSQWALMLAGLVWLAAKRFHYQPNVGDCVPKVNKRHPWVVS